MEWDDRYHPTFYIIICSYITLLCTKSRYIKRTKFTYVYTIYTSMYMHTISIRGRSSFSFAGIFLFFLFIFFPYSHLKRTTRTHTHTEKYYIEFTLIYIHNIGINVYNLRLRVINIPLISYFFPAEK